jgi:hypothetical protein
MNSFEFDYRQHVRDGGKLTLDEFKKRKRATFKKQGIKRIKAERELLAELRRLRSGKAGAT